MNGKAPSGDVELGTGQVIEINAPNYKDASAEERALWDQLVLTTKAPDPVKYADEMLRARRVRFGIR